jgi:general secretion pathway protein M
MKQWFMMLSSREKTIVSIAAVLVPLLLLWLLLLQPMITKHGVLDEQIQDRTGILQKMRQQSADIKQLQRNGGNRKVVSRGNPQQKVESALRTWRLRSSLGVMNQPNSRTVKLNLRDAEADNIMRFLFDVETKYGLTVKDFSLKPTKDIGKANASLTLEAQ